LRYDHLNGAQRGDLIYYLENFDALYDKYGSCYLIIKDKAVLGAYDRWSTALEETVKTHKPGTFILQECTKSGDDLLAERLGYRCSIHEIA
jgi:hypothetical protein